MISPSTSLVPVSHEKRAPQNLDFFVSEIGARWHKMTQGILEVSELCVQATRVLSRADLKALPSRLRFSKGTISKLVKIGNDQRLRNEGVRRHLPPSYSTIYLIAGLTDALLAAGIAEGIIRTDMQRADLEAWLNKGQDDPKPEVLFTLLGVEDLSESRLAMLQEKLRKALVDFPEVEAQSRDKKWTFRSYFRSMPSTEAA